VDKLDGVYDLKDGGDRMVYGTGAVREPAKNKGRFDLISPFALQRLALVYEKGAKKYADRNWEKGIPFSRFLDSAMRHLSQFAMGHTDEDHLGQAAWNIFAIMHFQETSEWDLDDLPDYYPSPVAMEFVEEGDLAKKKEEYIKKEKEKCDSATSYYIRTRKDSDCLQRRTLGSDAAPVEEESK